MSGGPETDAPAGPAGAPVPPRPSVFDLPTAPPTLPTAPQPAPAFDRNAEPTSNERPTGPLLNPTFYRTERERARSVYRRANPWYRRLGRGIVATCLIVAVAGGLYFGAQALQDYLSRDRLPGIGADVPTIRSSTFLVTAGAPLDPVDGTITVDTDTGAFRFTGTDPGPQAGISVISDGPTTQVSTDGITWRPATPADAVVADVRAIVPFLVDMDGSDDLLSNRLRPFVVLDDQTTEGVGDSAIERYEMSIDTDAFSEANALLWAAFEQQAIPGVAAEDAVPVTMWLDQDNVMVRLRATDSNWSWQRVSYSDDPFTPSTQS